MNKDVLQFWTWYLSSYQPSLVSTAPVLKQKERKLATLNAAIDDAKKESYSIQKKIAYRKKQLKDLEKQYNERQSFQPIAPTMIPVKKTRCKRSLNNLHYP